MTIVKINLHKVNAERSLEAKGGQVKINNNVSLQDVQQMDFAVEGKKGLRFNFAFNCSYEPDLGKIEVQGQVFYVGTDKKVDEVTKGWKESKRVPPDLMQEIVNAALHKGNIQAIKISEEISLPSPLPLPKVSSIEEKPKEQPKKE